MHHIFCVSLPPNGLLLLLPQSFKIVLLLLRRWASYKTASSSSSSSSSIGRRRRLSPTTTATKGRRQRRFETHPSSSRARRHHISLPAKRKRAPTLYKTALNHTNERTKRTKKRTSFLRARERPSLVPVLVVLELRPAFHDHAAEARVDARGCFRLDVVRGRRHDDDDVFGSRIVVRFLKWLNNMLTVDDEDHTLTFYVFRVLLSFFLR